VKLSKPGETVYPVSYIDKIDDENVLKALEALRRRAIGAAPKASPEHASNNKSKDTARLGLRTAAPERPYISSSSRDKVRKPAATERAPPTEPPPLVSHGNRTPVRGFRKRSGDLSTVATPKAGSRSKGAVMPISKNTPPKNTPPRRPSQPSQPSQPKEFVPLWKTNPSVKGEVAIPRWERETRALEWAVEKKERHSSAEARALAQFESLQKQALDDSGVLVSADTAGQSSTTAKFSNHKGAQNEGTRSKPPKTSSFPKNPRTSSAATTEDQPVLEALRNESSGGSNRSDKASAGLWKRLIFHRRGRTATEDEGFDDHATRGSVITSLGENHLGDEDSGVASLLESLCDFGCFNMMDDIFHPRPDDLTMATGFDDATTRRTVSDDEASERGFVSTKRRYTFDNSTFETDGETKDLDELTQRGLFELGPMITILEKFRIFLDGDESDPTQREYMTSLLEMMEERLQQYGGYRRRSRSTVLPDSHTVSEHIEDVNRLILRIVEDFIDKQLMKATNGVEALSWSSSVSLEQESSLGEADLPPTSPRSENSTTKQGTTSTDCSLSFALPLGLANLSATDLIRIPDIMPTFSEKRQEVEDGLSSKQIRDDDKSFLSSRTNTSHATSLVNNLTNMFSCSPRCSPPERSVSPPTLNREIPTKNCDKPRLDESSQNVPPLYPKVNSVKRMPAELTGTKEQSTTTTPSSFGVAVPSVLQFALPTFVVSLVDTSIDTSDGDSAKSFDELSA